MLLLAKILLKSFALDQVFNFTKIQSMNLSQNIEGFAT
jgi:hypothetical protein